MAGALNGQNMRQEQDVSSAVFGIAFACPVRFGHGTAECRTRIVQCPCTGVYFVTGHSLFDVGHLSYPVEDTPVPAPPSQSTKH